jgi:cytochrome b6-f complex iron-sulfur subunit
MLRKDFLSTIGFSLTAVCAGCLAACNPSNGITGAPAPTGVNFNVDLTSQLLNVGDSLIVGGVIVVRLAATNAVTSFTAVQLACTHQGISVVYNATLGEFVCPRHDSLFSTSGAVLQGPATKPLKQYTIAVTNTTLNVTG